MLSHREKWVYVLTIMKTNALAKKQPMETQSAICDFIRTQIAPDIGYPEWRQMELDMNETKKNVNRYMMEGTMASIGETKISPELQSLFASELPKLDDKVRSEMKSINLEDLRKHLPKGKGEIIEKINRVFAMVLDTKGEMKDNGKNKG